MNASVSATIPTNQSELNGASHVSPNPWKRGISPSVVTFSGLAEDSSVKIYTRNGLEVANLSVGDNSTVTWDLRNKSGRCDAAAEGKAPAHGE